MYALIYVKLIEKYLADLDSAASAIAYAYMANLANPTPRYAALFRQDREAIHLRPENQLVFSDVGLDTASDLLTLDDLGNIEELQVGGFALVDHNSLADGFSGHVAAVIEFVTATIRKPLPS